MRNFKRPWSWDLISDTSFPYVTTCMADFNPTFTFFQISAVMDKFESQFEDLDVATGYYETATSSATAVGTPQDEVDRLIHLVADEAGIELKEEMKSPEQAALTKDNVDEEEREGALGERLRALRN